MGTKERIEILNSKDNVINGLLKRVSDLEFEVEKYENILDTLEKHLLDNWKNRLSLSSFSTRTKLSSAIFTAKSSLII